MNNKEYMKRIIECAKKIDITKVDSKVLEEIAKSKNLLDLPEELQCDIMIIGSILLQAQLNKKELSEEEMTKAANIFYIELCLEYLVRKGLMERIGEWNYKNFGKCEYKLTEKGKEEGEKFLEKLRKEWEKENLRYIG
jgi:hypothetical protein